MRAAALLLLLAACGAPPPQPEKRALVARVPQREELPCFPCHSQVKFEKGPPFPHAKAPHKFAGHCHLCHEGMGHEGKTIDRAACLGCHEEGSPEITAGLGQPSAAAPPTSDTPSK